MSLIQTLIFVGRNPVLPIFPLLALSPLSSEKTAAKLPYQLSHTAHLPAFPSWSKDVYFRTRSIPSAPTHLLELHCWKI